jgi:choice-of-anchor B domain-containing protein
MVCDQGPSTLQIADLHYLPDSVPLVYDFDSLIIRCHNIFIDTTTKRLYACGVSIPDTVKERRVDLQIYDLSNGYLPELLLTYYDENIEQFHDIFVKNDTAFGNNGNTGLFFYDFSDLSDTLIMGSVLDYPEKGYNHAGYATEDGKYYYFSDETHGRGLKALRVDNFKDPEVVAVFSAGRNEKETVAHNLLVRGNLLLVSYYHEGLQVYDISKPSKPIRIGHYQTFTTQIQPNPNYPPSKDYGGYSGAWGVYPYLPSGFILVSDREKGMFIFDISDIDGKRHPELLPSKFIFPNPAGNYIDLVYPTKDIVEVELYDVNGKLVEQSTNFKEQDRVTRIEFRQAVQQGLYILKVKTRNGSFTEKLLRE